MRSKFAFYVSLAALIFGCLVILDLVIGEGVTGWLFTIGAIGNLVSIPSAIILELTAENRKSHGVRMERSFQNYPFRS